MTDQRNQRISALIAQATGEAASPVVATHACSGGCIHRAEIVTLASGQRFFVKSSRNARTMFETEADGLNALAATQTLATPGVIALGQLVQDEDCLILEAIDQGQPEKDFFEQFGSTFARMHRHQAHDRYGFDNDNFLGSNHQSNEWSADWAEFFGRRRLGFQLQLARKQGNGSRELFKLGDRLIEGIGRLINTDSQRPSLLHGDLWSGNFMVSQGGYPIIFDPAVYYGCREADLAMPWLFGGFPAAFFGGYQEEWPLESGWEDRLEIYKLYHLLNHLNLFGSGYLESCLDILRRYS